MISISGKKWVENKVNRNLVEKIKQDFNFKDILAKLVVSRNFDLTEINNINLEQSLGSSQTRSSNACGMLNSQLCIL